MKQILIVYTIGLHMYAFSITVFLTEIIKRKGIRVLSRAFHLRRNSQLYDPLTTAVYLL